MNTVNNKQEESKDNSQNIKPIKKLSLGDRFLLQMQQNQKKKEKERFQNIKAEAKKQNPNLETNLVKNFIENEKKNQEDLKQKKLQNQKEEKEREQRRRETMKKISEQQKAKKMKDEEKKKKEEEEKKIKEEEKKKKEKEWRDEMDKNRVGIIISEYNTSQWKESAYNKIRLSSKHNTKEKKYDGQETKIFIDLTNSLSQYIIYGYDKDGIIKKQFKNSLSYYKINREFHCDFLEETLNIKLHNGTTKFSVNEGDCNWEIMELLLQYILEYEINFNFLEECSLLFAEPINFQRCDREKIAEILFEGYNLKKIFIIKPSLLSLLSEGKYTGIVSELQNDISNFIPIFDGYSLPHGIIKSNLCRNDVIQYKEELLKGKFENIVNKSYNNNCFGYDLPDGNEIFIDKQRYEDCLEILFNPQIYPRIKNKKGIAFNLNESIKKCDKDIQNQLYNNIVLTGINSKIPGIKERMAKEIYNLNHNCLNKDQIGISCNEDIQKGVESFFSNPKYEPLWFQKEEYEEYGNIIGTKCF